MDAGNALPLSNGFLFRYGVHVEGLKYFTFLNYNINGSLMEQRYNSIIVLQYFIMY
uniref:Uncharacterized protein n=1 Tax=Octopus bimaculoides TaxID=37653 RepID=A0A0L8I8X5_OCTBM